MKKQTVVLIALALSLAVNIFLGSLFLGQNIGKREGSQSRPFQTIMEQIRSLPEEQHKAAIETLQSAKPELQAAILEAREVRKEAFAYIKSPEYTRTEAEKRLAKLRDKTAAVQTLAQRTMLDLADQLTPEQRVEFLKNKHGERPW